MKCWLKYVWQSKGRSVPTQLTQFNLSRLMEKKIITTPSQTKHHLPLLMQQIFSESQSCSVTSNSLWHHGLYSPWNSPSQNTGVGSLSLLQGIFPTQGSNPGLPHCRQILHQLSHQGSPRILEWVAYPFSRGSSWPRNQTGVFCIAGRILYQLSYGSSKFSVLTTIQLTHLFTQQVFIEWLLYARQYSSPLRYKVK